jgi:LPS-assembly lipoprotein
MNRRLLLIATIALPLAGCGFKLRGETPLRFNRIYIDAPTSQYQHNSLANRLRKLIEAAGTKLADSPKDADLVLKLGDEKRVKTILSLTGAGRVGEYRLELDQRYQASTPDGKQKIPETELKFLRDMSYDDNLYTAKQAEEEFLYKSMEEDAAQQIVRHLRRIPAQGG